MHTNPLYGVIRTLLLLATGRVRFSKPDVGREIEMADGARFTIFRRVRIRNLGGAPPSPKGLFIVRFTPTMPVAKNIQLSRIMLLVFMGFKGFRSKYWCVNETTGECQGIYEWDTVADATRYSKSIAVRNMTRRSRPGSISFEVLDNTAENRRWRISDPAPEARALFKAKYHLT
jgi:hypothetical protein